MFSKISVRAGEWRQRHRGLAVSLALVVICAVVWWAAHFVAERRRYEKTRKEVYGAFTKALMDLTTGERTVRADCLASTDKTKLADVDRAYKNGDMEGMAALAGKYGPVFTIKAGTKVYMETIETLGGRLCVSSCAGYGYARVHIESAEHIGTDVWISSIYVEYSKEEVLNGTVERSQRPTGNKDP